MAIDYNPDYSVYNSKFQFYVAWVDYASTIDDKQQVGTVEDISPQTGRNLHIGGFKLNREGGGIALNVLVTQDVLGSFKMPQIGDVVWIEETRRQGGQAPVYLYSTYNSSPLSQDYGPNPVPQWGSMQNDYGHLRSHRDHNRQFASTVSDADFRTKFIRSITGYRMRHFYRSNLTQGNFVLRGDPVFDITSSNNKDYIISNGEDIGYGVTLESDKGIYPNPLNVPKARETDHAYTYSELQYEPITQRITANHYDIVENTSPWVPTYSDIVLKNKHYNAYQPIMDKKYLNKANFERELPAAEEYQVALRGNNKLLIQDQYGDGEQLLITLKSQYDEQFTIVHNGNKGQIRLRDHLGQGVLLEADPNAPRVVSWTVNKQVVEQGAVTGHGTFTYIRNGGQFGDAQTSFGTKTGLTKDGVSNQELLMVSDATVIADLSSRLSSGMNTLASSGNGAGLYFRNTPDGTNPQEYSLYNNGTQTVASIHQIYGNYSSSRTQTVTGTSSTETAVVADINNNKVTEVSTVANGLPSKTTTVTLAGTDVSTITQNSTSIDVTRLIAGIALNLGVDGQTGGVNIGNPSDTVTITGTAIHLNNV